MTDNELIAEFMGTCEHMGWIHINERRYGIQKKYYPQHLRYSTSWDWLMPVVEKIHSSMTYKPYFTKERFGVEVTIKPNYCNIYLPDTSGGYDYVNGCYEKPNLFSITNSRLPEGTIGCVYNSVVEFIKWYNENGKEKT